jgi:chromosome segregation ATPase
MKKRVRGMRHLMTPQTLSNRHIPQDRAQLVAKMARLEHERSRLEREREVWLTKQRQTEQRLNGIQAQLEALQTKLDSLTTPPSKPRSQDDDWVSFSLEY